MQEGKVHVSLSTVVFLVTEKPLGKLCAESLIPMEKRRKKKQCGCLNRAGIIFSDVSELHNLQLQLQK